MTKAGLTKEFLLLPIDEQVALASKAILIHHKETEVKTISFKYTIVATGEQVAIRSVYSNEKTKKRFWRR